MASYNHSAIEKKWRENWEKNPSMSMMAKSRNYYCRICSRIRPAADFM